jgi:hypothetical protein
MNKSNPIQSHKNLINENFIFIQYSKDDPKNQYIQYYFPTKDDLDAYPYIAIVDPRTGEQVKLWSGPLPLEPWEFFMQLVEFLDRHSLMIDKSGNPVVERKTQKGKSVGVDRTAKDRNELVELYNSDIKTVRFLLIEKQTYYNTLSVSLLDSRSNAIISPHYIQ